MLASFERKRFDLVIFAGYSTQASGFRSAKQTMFSLLTVKYKHFLAVLLCFGKIFRENRCGKVQGI